jgi:hypothetical protein
MKIPNRLHLSDAWVNVILLVCSSIIYFLYFHDVLLNLNSVLSSITGDSLKNYFTYAYHTRNDREALHFTGMNFPFGEHVVYTDCQPLLTFILRCLPFTHNYLIGILHALLFGSFIISPLILYRVFRRLEIQQFPAFFFSLGITLLSPQFAKINGGHHGLAYGCVIPLAFLLFLRLTSNRNLINVTWLFVFNSGLFFLHPYLGFGASLLTFVSLLLMEILQRSNKTAMNLFQAIITGILPIVFFKIFMLLTDHHPSRTTEPYGNDALVENPSTLLAPDFGPFQPFLTKLFPGKIGHFEGHSYLGLFTIVMLAVFLITLPFLAKKIRIKKEALALLITSFMLLMVSFGVHVALMNRLGLSIASLNQFRAVCRFAWYFYHALPVFLVVTIYYSVASMKNKINGPFLSILLPLLFFALNMVEADAYLKKDRSAFWKFRNILNEEQLSKEEERLISEIKTQQAQAIIPLPLFMLGSEMYDRVGGDNSLVPSVLISFHAKLPIMSTWLSRTSMTETAQIVELLNSYKKNRPAVRRLNGTNFIVVNTTDQLLPDETRLSATLSPFYRNDSLQISVVTQDQLLRRKINEKELWITGRTDTTSRDLIVIHSANRRPFTEARIKDYELVALVDSNSIKPGHYIVSLHYHYNQMNYRSLACNLIITRGHGSEYAWQHLKPMSVMSGVYPGFGVIEHRITIEEHCRYEFIIKGDLDVPYHISDFMLRPENVTVTEISPTGGTITNNFPE